MKKLLVLLTGIFIVINSNGQTNVSGGIYANTTWTLAGSPYIVSDTVVIFGGITLTIQPGVVVKFNDSALIENRGNLYANGTATDSIIFTSNSATPHAGIYNGIQITSDTESFTYCRFSYANIAINVLVSLTYALPIKHCVYASNLEGISGYFSSSTPIIDSCLFKHDTIGIYEPAMNTIMECKFIDNGTGIYQLSGPALNCTFRNNNYGIHYVHTLSTIANCTIDSNRDCGIYNGGGDTIRNCTVKYNNVGIFVYGVIVIFNDISDNKVGLKLLANNNAISCNTICSNTDYNIVADVSTNQLVSNNYWCLPDSAAIQATIYDAYQDISLGFVFFTPFDTIACVNTTAVIELSASPTKINLFPNPNNGSFTLESSNLTGHSSIEIYNMLGEVVYKSTITQSTSQISLNNSIAGVYLYRIISEKGNLVGTGKFVVE